MNGPSLADNMAAVPKRMALDLEPVTGREVLKPSASDVDLDWVAGRTMPDIGRPVAVRGRELDHKLYFTTNVQNDANEAELHVNQSKTQHKMFH